MTTSQKLWLGFGTLTALLLLFGVVLWTSVRSIQSNVQTQANEARPRSDATRELKLNVVGYALALRTFFQTDDPKFRLDASRAVANIDHFLAEYERFSATERHRELALRFAVLWKEFREYGQALLDSKARPLKNGDSERLSNLRIGLERFRDEEMQKDAGEIFQARRDVTFRELEAALAFAAILLAVGVVVAVATSAVFARAVVKSERTVAEQAERLRTTLASIGDAVITTDTAGLVTNLNAVAESLTGWTNAEALGQPLAAVFAIVNEDSRKTVENPAVRALREGVIVRLANHTILIAKDGTEHPIDDSAAPISCAEGEIVGCVLVFRDVGTQRRDARRIALSEARKTAILATALDCIITIDHRGHIVEFNPAAERTFGYSRADALGRDTGDLIVPPLMRQAHRDGMARYLLTGEGPVLNRRIELTAVRASGTEFPVEVAITQIPGDGPPLFDTIGRVFAMLDPDEFAAI